MFSATVVLIQCVFSMTLIVHCSNLCDFQFSRQRILTAGLVTQPISAEKKLAQWATACNSTAHWLVSNQWKNLQRRCCNKCHNKEFFALWTRKLFRDEFLPS